MPSKILNLSRISHTPFGTFGVLSNKKGHPLLLTVEKPWKDNIPFESCIPFGSYNFKRHLSPKFGETFIIENVPSRSHILFHCGNQHTDTHGCVLVGDEFSYFSQASKPGVVNPGVSNSRDAFRKLIAHLDGCDGGIINIFPPCLHPSS